MLGNAMTLGGSDDLAMTSKRGRFFSFLVALGIVALATVVRFPISTLLGDATPFLFYLPAVVIVAVLFGRGPGILATAASALLANYFWMRPQGAFSVGGLEFLELLMFSIAGVSLALLSEKWHRERSAKERLYATLSNAGNAIITTDAAGRVVFLNPAAQMLTELAGDEVIGQAIGGVLFLRSEEGDNYLNHALQQALLKDQLDHLPKHLILTSKSGKRHRVEQRICRILDGKGKPAGAVILLHDQRVQS